MQSESSNSVSLAIGSMKVVSAAQMQCIERACIENIGIPERVLMELAGRACVTAILKSIKHPRRSFCIFSGNGNNGGDGYVIARILLSQGADVKVFQLPGSFRSETLDAVRKSFSALGGEIVTLPASKGDITKVVFNLSPDSILVDALTGTGYIGPLREGALSCLILALDKLREQRGNIMISIDVPSGNSADEGGESSGIHADETFALQCLKSIHVDPEKISKVGRVRVLDIGIPSTMPELCGVKSELMLPRLISSIIRMRFPDPLDAYKGSKGHVLVIGGSRGFEGAPVISAHSAFRAGAGLVTLATPEGCARGLMPEVMHAVFPVSEDGVFKGVNKKAWLKVLGGKHAIVLGPGLSSNANTLGELLAFLMEYVREQNVPTVVDADALNLISDNKSLQDLVSSNMVLTPHVGEFSKLSGLQVQDINNRRMELSLKYISNFPCTLILKGARTVVTSSDGAQYISPFCEPILGVAGSGDALAGIITALMARGYSAREASILAVYLHGAVGSRAAARSDISSGLFITEIIEYLPECISELVKGLRGEFDSSSSNLPLGLDF